MGLLNDHFYYRRAVGLGYALLGDAGNYKDFVTGHGMTDDLLGAQTLCAAILDGSDEAYEWYWRKRDVDTMPLYFDSKRQGTAGSNTPFMGMFMRRLGENPEYAFKLVAVVERLITPTELVSPGKLFKWVLAEVLRGCFWALKACFSIGKEMGDEEKEIAYRRALLEELKTRYTPPDVYTPKAIRRDAA